MKLTDLADHEKQFAVLDKDGNILCPVYEKNLAKVTEYGTVRRCKKCEKAPRDTIFISHDDCCGRRCG